MAHINVKAQDRGATFPDADSAILQVVALQKWSRYWEFGGASFGQTIEQRRAIDKAIKEKNSAAFKASQRRGHWKVELA